MKNLLAFLLIPLALTLSASMARAKNQVIDVQVTEDGFVPKSIDVKAGTSVTLKVTRTTDSTCATEIKIQSKNIKEKLPLNKPVTVALGKLEKGEVRFGCSMDMITGLVVAK